MKGTKNFCQNLEHMNIELFIYALLLTGGEIRTIDSFEVDYGICQNI